MDILKDDFTIGLFGAGHLARSLASRFILNGVDEGRLSICHRGSPATSVALRDAGLSHLVREPAEVVKRSQMLLYTVRPQDYAAIAEYTTSPDALFVSFLAGVPLNRIPVAAPGGQRIRVMPSAPDTLMGGNAIAAVYPASNVYAHALLKLMGARIYPVHEESQLHAFTVLGPCLPVALTLWESMGRTVEDGEILAIATSFGLPDPAGILKWARAARPPISLDSQLDRYLSQAATKGGVTEGILDAMRAGASLPDSLRSGIKRSIELSQEAEE